MFSVFHNDQEISPISDGQGVIGGEISGPAGTHLASGSRQEQPTGDCAICLGEYEMEIPYQIPCKGMHTYHKGCILRWLHNHSDCPLCREALPEDVLSKLRPRPAPSTQVMAQATPTPSVPSYPRFEELSVAEVIALTVCCPLFCCCACFWPYEIDELGRITFVGASVAPNTSQGSGPLDRHNC